MSLVPSTQFRQGFRASHRLHREPHLTPEAQATLHQVYTALLRLLPAAKHYTDIQQHGTVKLTTYFALLMYCCISRSEKLMVSFFDFIKLSLNIQCFSLDNTSCNSGIYSIRSSRSLRFRRITTNKLCWRSGIMSAPIAPRTFN